MISPGFHPDLAATYHSAPPVEALTQSKIKILLDQTPFDLRYGERERSDEMDFGSIVHALALGKGARYAIAPYDDYRTKEAREWRDTTIAAGIVPIKADKHAEAEAVAKSAQAALDRLLGQGGYQTEVPFYWQEDGTWCGGMLDVWCEELLLAVDIKVTGSLGAGAASGMVRYGWDLQAAWYLRGLEQLMPSHAGRIRFVNLLVKPVPPYTTRITSINEAWRASAEAECWRGLRIWRQCMESGVWPGYTTDVEVLTPPAWIVNDRLLREASE